MAEWNTPHVWTLNEAITATKLNNTEDNLRYLFDRPRSSVLVNGGVTSPTTASATLVEVDDLRFTLTLPVVGSRVKINLSAAVSSNSTTALVVVDVLMDGATLLSSMTGAGLTNGIWSFRFPVANIPYSLPGQPFVVGVTPGIHTFQLRWKALNTGTLTFHLMDSMCYFGAEEV